MSFSFMMEFSDKKLGETKFIKKINGKWRVISAEDGKPWDAIYNTAKDAHAALGAYWAQKNKK